MKPIKLRAALLLLALLALGFAGLAEGPSEDMAAPIVLNEKPDFSDFRETRPCIRYGAPDALGRATAACALLDRSLLTSEDRPDMAEIRLPGLHNSPYDFIRDRWVYNRCHLIGHRFGGASTPENLIAGTHALNFSYMLPWEDQVADYIRRTGKRVYYRVTPVYEGDELVCRAVRIDAQSADKKLRFSVLCPNVQPGVAIDYLTGYTTLADDWASGGTTAGVRTHVINTKTGKFHLPGCKDEKKVSKRNRVERVCHRSELLAEGLIPCGKCRP